MGTGATDAGHRIPDISVIVPVYNAEMTLHRCIKGILSQSYTDFELLLVNDGSTDASPEICGTYARTDSRVRVLDKPNGGVSSARNLGLDNAAGRYVAFCDSDDYPEKDWLLSMRKQAGESGLVVCAYHIHSPEGSVSNRSLPGEDAVREYDDPEAILGDLLGGGLLNFIWNKLFVRRQIEDAALRFEEAFKVFEDEYFVLNYLASGFHTVYVPYRGYDYFLPSGFCSKYSFDADHFIKVAQSVYGLLGLCAPHAAGKRRRKTPEIPSLVYWYKVALGRYAAGHTYRECKEKIRFARRLAIDFRSGWMNHLSVIVLPSRAVYFMLRLRNRKSKC